MTLPYAPRADSLASQVLAFFKANPEESLLLDDIQEKFACTRGNIHTLLGPAVEGGLLFRGKDGDDEWVYIAGSKLQANAHTVPAPAPKGYARPRHTLDLDAIKVEDNIPVMPAPNGRGGSKWDELFAKLSKPGQSVALPGHVKGAIAAATHKRNKEKRGTYYVAMTAPGECRLRAVAGGVEASGVHQPILVRPLPGTRLADTERGVQYEIIAGERRYRASVEAGLPTIPAMIRALTDDQALEVMLVENVMRDDLTELEEAEGYETLMQHSHLTAEQVGEKIGKSRSYVYGRIKLLDLCQEARASLRDRTIDASRALLVARIPDHKLQIKAMKEIVKGDTYFGSSGEPMGYRKAADHVQRNWNVCFTAKTAKGVTGKNVASIVGFHATELEAEA